MSTDELRRMLDYPDDRFVVDLAAVRERAHQHQVRRRRRGAIGVMGAACAVALAVTIGPLAGSEPRTVLVSPGDVDALAQALRSVIADAGMRLHLSDAAFAAARKLPTWRESGAIFATALEKLA